MAFVHYSVGAFYIKQLLHLSRTLEFLALQSNNIGDDGISTISEGLQHNSTLTELYIRNCGLSMEGISYLQLAICENFDVHKQLTIQLSNIAITTIFAATGMSFIKFQTHINMAIVVTSLFPVN